MNSSREIHRDFHRDIRQKKRVGSNIMKAKGKRGYVGKMITTIDLLSAKEKRQYMKSGAIKLSNVYKQIIPLEELKTYTPEMQKQIVEEWRNRHTQAEIVEGLQTNRNVYYSLLYDLEILEKPNYIKKQEDQKEEKERIKDKIIPYDEFKKLSIVEQYHLLGEWNKKLKAGEIGEVWGKSATAIHQLRYALKKKIEKLPPEEREREEVSPAVAISTDIEKESQMSKNTEVEEESDVFSIAEEENESDRLKETVEGIKEVLQLFRQELTSQSEMIKNLKGDIEELERKEKQVVPYEGTGQHSDTMVLKLEDEKEGFLLHNQIERFITVLKKNPDNFKVNIRLTKIDD